MTVKGCPKCREETAHFNGECAKCGFGKKSYCAECHISFGLAETRVATPQGDVHQDCYTKVFARSRPVLATLSAR